MYQEKGALTHLLLQLQPDDTVSLECFDNSNKFVGGCEVPKLVNQIRAEEFEKNRRKGPPLRQPRHLFAEAVKFNAGMAVTLMKLAIHLLATLGFS